MFDYVDMRGDNMIDVYEMRKQIPELLSYTWFLRRRSTDNFDEGEAIETATEAFEEMDVKQQGYITKSDFIVFSVVCLILGVFVRWFHTIWRDQ